MKGILNGKRLQKWILSLLIPAFVTTGGPVQANPSGGVVVHGAADIARISANQLRIHQQSNNVVINWQNFSIANGEMTQAELADRIGVTRQTVIAIEQGRYSPSLEMAFQIARVFGLPLDSVFHYPSSEGESR